MRRRPQRGFTLIELMTVLAIIAIITISLASLSSSEGASTPRQTADRITGMMQFARLRSEARRTIHRVSVSNTTVEILEGNTTGFTAPTAFTVVQSMAVPSGVVIWNTSGTVASAGGINPAQSGTVAFNIDFKPDGQSTGGTIFLADAASQSKFRVFVYKVTGTAMARENH